jgi:hypothetical protein
MLDFWVVVPLDSQANNYILEVHTAYMLSPEDASIMFLQYTVTV